MLRIEHAIAINGSRQLFVQPIAHPLVGNERLPESAAGSEQERKTGVNETRESLFHGRGIQDRVRSLASEIPF